MKDKRQQISMLIFLLVAGTALFAISHMQGEKYPQDSVLSTTPSFQNDLELASNGRAERLNLTENGKPVGGYPLRSRVARNAPTLSSYQYIMCDAPEETGGQIVLWLINNNANFVFYEGTNIVSYHSGGNDAVAYYEAQERFSEIENGINTLYDRVLMWYDEAELDILRYEVEDTPIPNRGQSWEEAAKEYLDAYEGVHLQARSGSQFKFTWMKNLVRSAADEVAQWPSDFRLQPEENVYYFYSTTEFVPETQLALNSAMAGNTDNCSDPDAPEGAYEYYRNCSIRLDENGWYGTMYGTGGW